MSGRLLLSAPDMVIPRPRLTLRLSRPLSKRLHQLPCSVLHLAKSCTVTEMIIEHSTLRKLRIKHIMANPRKLTTLPLPLLLPLLIIERRQRRGMVTTVRLASPVVGDSETPLRQAEITMVRERWRVGIMADSEVDTHMVNRVWDKDTVNRTRAYLDNIINKVGEEWHLRGRCGECDTRKRRDLSIGPVSRKVQVEKVISTIHDEFTGSLCVDDQKP